jgi:Nuclease-related domain
MTLRRRKEAGSSARAEFRRLRWQKVRERWYDWVVMGVAIAGALAAIVVFDGRVTLIWAALLGVFVTLAFLVWMIGGEVHSLPWLWGAIGEEATAEALESLEGSWECEHDLPHEFGNWDHVVVGPGGIFLLDTKRLSGEAVANGDALRSGRLRFSGASLRRSACALREQLMRRVDPLPWVQSVFVVWGTFPQRLHEENRVVYLRGDELVPWLSSQPQRLTGDRLDAVRDALRRLREETPARPTPVHQT